MRARARSHSGFALIESLVAMTLITIGALALATTMLNGAAVNNRNLTRQQALAVAYQQIDRFRSMDYADVGMAPAANGAAYVGGAYTSTSMPDWGRCQPDWARGETAGPRDAGCPPSDTYGASPTQADDADQAKGFCPLSGPTTGGAPAQLADCTVDERDPSGLGRIVTRRGANYDGDADSTDPRRAKITSAPTPDAGQDISDSRSLVHGLVVYTYVYRPLRKNPNTSAGATCPTATGAAGTVVSAWCPARDRKVVTVVVRYRDEPETPLASGYQSYASVKLSTLIVENAGISLRQIPQP